MLSAFPSIILPKESQYPAVILPLLRVSFEIQIGSTSRLSSGRLFLLFSLSVCVTTCGYCKEKMDVSVLHSRQEVGCLFTRFISLLLCYRNLRACRLIMGKDFTRPSTASSQEQSILKYLPVAANFLPP